MPRHMIPHVMDLGPTTVFALAANLSGVGTEPGSQGWIVFGTGDQQPGRYVVAP